MEQTGLAGVFEAYTERFGLGGFILERLQNMAISLYELGCQTEPDKLALVTVLLEAKDDEEFYLPHSPDRVATWIAYYRQEGADYALELQEQAKGLLDSAVRHLKSINTFNYTSPIKEMELLFGQTDD